MSWRASGWRGFAAAALFVAAGLAASPLARAQGAAAASAGEARPMLMLEQGAHSAPVRRLDADPARGVVVTASDDRTARIWDFASGELRHVLRPSAFGAEGGRLYGVALHPTQPWVAVGGTTGGEGRPHAIYLFSITSGELLRTIDAKAGDVRKLAWSRDGSVLLATYAGQHGVRAFDRDGRELLHRPMSAPAFGLAVSAQGQAAAVGLDGQLLLLRAADGAASVSTEVSLGGRRAAGLSFSPDGRSLAVGFAEPQSPVVVLDAASGAQTAAMQQPTDERQRWDGDFRVVAWSADGATIRVAGTATTRDLVFPVYRYDVASRRLVGQAGVATDSVTDLVPLPDGGVAWTSFDGSWGVLDAREVSRRHASGTTRVVDPERLLLSADARAASWEASAGSGSRAFEFAQRRAGSAPRVPVRRPELRFLVGEAPSDWNLARVAPLVGGKRMALAADERSRALVVLRASRTAAIGTNRALYLLGDQGDVRWRSVVDTEIRALNASADGRAIVSAMADGTLRWWRASDGAHLLTLLVSADGRWVAWTPSGYFDASVGADRLVGWAVDRGQQRPMDFHSLGRFRDRFYRPDLINALLETLDERSAAERLADAEQQARDAAARDAQAREVAAAQAAIAAEREAEAARQAAAREQQARAEQARAEQARRQAEQASREAEAQRQAAAQSAREQADRELALRREAERQAAAREVALREAAAEAERQRLRAEAEREKAARQAAAEAFAARVAAEEARARDEAARQKRILEAVKALEVPPALHGTEARRLRATAPEVAIPFSVTSAGPASQLSLEVRVNGRPVQPLELQVPGTLDGNARGVARVRVAEGESLVEIIARNAWGASEPLSFQVERALAAARPPAAQGDLYILAVGISEYARPDYRLDLAAKDAQDFAQAMRVQEARLYRRVHVRMLTNREATRAAIAREFEWLRNSVGPGDVAMLFMAGHGVNDSSGQYFFLPHDGQHDRLVGTAVSQAMIVGTLSRIRGKTVMFLDSCYAGNTLGALSRNGRQTEKLMNELSASENGVVVFASSTGQEESEERLDWGNGAFTKALLDGLGGRADFTRAGRVTFAALNLYLSEEVTRMTQGRQRPVFISPRGIPDFALARL